VNDCQIDSYDHYLVRLNSEAVSAKVGLSVAAVVVVVVVAVVVETETENAETAVRMGADYLHLNLR
jgi:phage baseplate assembly protein gpV